MTLDCLTVFDVGPFELLRIAAEAGYASVSLWVQEPALVPTMLATSSLQGELARAVVETGVTVSTLEVYNLNSDAPIDGFERSLAFGASLGARSATAINFGPAREDIAERLAAFHGLCRGVGVETRVEPISMGRTRTIEDGVALIRAAGVDARLVVDCLHLIRAGGTPASVAAAPPGLIGAIQICDGPAVIDPDAMLSEAAENRLYPGTGEFPIREILAAAPEAALSVEIPNRRRMLRNIGPLAHAREAHRTTTSML